VAASAPGLALARWCRALGHPARIVIVRHLASRREPCTAGEIAAQVPLAQSTVSRHLQVLVSAGLLRAQEARPRVYYQLDEQVLAEFRRTALSL
jgi:ArsR family transcriptional regulator